VCLLLVWKICDQTFARYRPLNSGCRKVVTWPSRKLKICIKAHVEKFSDSKNVFFRTRRKITKLSRKTVSEQWRHQALVAFSARHSSRTKHRSRILSYSFDLQSCLHKYKRLACQEYGNMLEEFSVKCAKNADSDWS